MACVLSNETTSMGTATQPPAAFISADHVRTMFAHAVSAMYRREVPLYGDLVQIVQQTNSSSTSDLQAHDSLQRLSLERHGAIRLGTAQELCTIKHLFRVMGMHAVGYYDLSVAGLPMHATCFRPTCAKSLEANPFRIFTTLLRPDMLQSDESKSIAEDLLRHRKIFTPALLQLLDAAEKQDGRLSLDQVEVLIPEALSTFSWQPVAAASRAQYMKLCNEHPILADIACFRSAHINHLTPRVLDIDAAKTAMELAEMPVKASIEGPPKRKWPILLRQTSFLALEEQIRFRICEQQQPEDNFATGSHKARFGEIEERGAAVTPKGRQLYDFLLKEASSRSANASSAERDLIFSEVFLKFPDVWSDMRREGLVYCVYKRTSKAVTEATKLSTVSNTSNTLAEKLISQGLVQTYPITYEDFLPFSAAGIFQSNLQTAQKDEQSSNFKAISDQEGFEQSLGGPLINSDDLYLQIENDSLRDCVESLGIKCSF